MNREQLNRAIFCARLIDELYYGQTTKPNVVNTSTDTQALVYRAENSPVAYVIFPGTASFRDWQTDLKFRKSDWIAGRVHRGFKAAVESVLRDILGKLVERAATKVVIAGHSLGGALAMLLAHKLATVKPQIVTVAEVYTFGQPRVGSWNFKWHYDANLHDQTFRIVNQRDPVTHMPFVFGTYKHAGTEVYLADDGTMNIDAPMWTGVLEAPETARQLKEQVTAPEKAEANFALISNLLGIPRHKIPAYIAKLEAQRANV